MLSKKEKLIKLIHDFQYQLKVPFMLYADFESSPKPVNERYEEKMKQMKAGKKS